MLSGPVCYRERPLSLAIRIGFLLRKAMKQLRVRWGDLGSPVRPGTYSCGPHMVEVTPGDIKLANGNPDTVFNAIHPDFYSDDTPYLLTGVAS